MRKRIIFSLLIFMAALMGLLVGCSKKSETTRQVTRGEWITMLSEAFCLDTYDSNTPYYFDVNNDSPLFPPVQATAERGIISIYDDDKLEPDRPVTRDEAASTAAIAAGFVPNEKGMFDTKTSIEYSIENGIISEAGKAHLTKDECATILNNAQDVYLTNPRDEKIEVDYSDTLVDLRGMSEEIIFINDNEIIFPGSLNAADSATIFVNNQAIQIHEGDTFLAPSTEEQPVGTAYKVTSIRAENGQVIFSIASPSFGDIYDYADIHTTVSLSDSSIIWANGVQVSPVSFNGSPIDSHRYHIQFLSNRESGGHSLSPNIDSFSRHWQVKFNTGINRIRATGIPDFLEHSPEAQALETSSFIYDSIPSLEDFAGTLETWTKELKKEKKYSDGYDITIDLDLKLAAIVDISYDKSNFTHKEYNLCPESVSMVLHSNIITDFTVEGSVGEEKKFELGQVIVPVGQTGLTLNGYLFLYLETTGDIEIKLEMENTQRTGWSAKEGQQGYQPPVRKRPGQWGNTSSAEVIGSIDLSTGVGLEIDLSTFSTVKLIGVDLKTGGDLEAKGTLTGKCTEQSVNGVAARHYTETINLGSTFYLPITTLTVSGPDELSDILGLEKSWEIITKDKASKIPFIDTEWVIWEKTVELDEVDEISFDFSPYIGTYEPYNLTDGQTASPLRINSDGTIWGESGYSGGGVVFSNPLEGNDIKPSSVVTHDNGTIECILANEDFDTFTENDMVRLGYRIRYIIYPPGIVQDIDGLNKNWLEETKDKIRIQYLLENNGIEDIWYCQSGNEGEETNNQVDFALFAGVYEPYARGYGVVSNLNYSNLILSEDGSLQGNYTHSSENRNITTEIAGNGLSPSHIDYNEDGTINVTLLSDEDYTVFYIIVPPNVDISGYISTGVDAQAHKDKTRIIYIKRFIGAAIDIYYYKP